MPDAMKNPVVKALMWFIGACVFVFGILPYLAKTLIPDAFASLGSTASELSNAIVAWDVSAGTKIAAAVLVVGSLYFLHHDHHSKGWKYVEGTVLFTAFSVFGPLLLGWLHDLFLNIHLGG